jgi:signal transduction histidine kinase/ActR/RegA family two-component response regulator
VWLFDADRAALRAVCVIDGDAVEHEPHRAFLASEHPEYFRALTGDRVLAATDARTDPRTKNMAPSYLQELGVTSMMDSAILSHGTMIGVVCHEHRGGQRVWTIEETDFAASIADVAALALEESKRLALEEQLRQSQKMEAIGLVAGGISHDFNNLLNIILGYAELAARQLPDGHPAAGHLGQITSACARAAQLIRKILTFSRGSVLSVEPLDFGQVLREFSGLLTRVLGDDIELSVSASDETMIVHADRTHLEQILLNLCTNARQAMPQGGRLTLDAKPEQVDGESPGRYVHLRVADTGHGIDDATMSRLWEPFFTTKTEGTGLGLSVVYGIVRQHGGLIRAESRVGHGSTFHVFLPLHHELAPRPAAPPVSLDLRGRETILVVEDEPLIRELLKESLSALGYTVLGVGSGEEAVRTFFEHPEAVDLVILDVVMPRVSGLDTLARMQEAKPGIKALFISGHAPDSARLAEQLRAAGRAFLPKPFHLEMLAAKVRAILDERV